MFRTYCKTAWRNITRHRFYAAANIIGLSTGITFTLLICSYILSQLQVNTRLKNAHNQYIIQSSWKNPNEGFDIATAGPLAKALKENYPNLIANYYRFDGVTSNIAQNGVSFRENMQIGDSTLLSMYGFSLLQGDARTALSNPFTVVITREKAMKYFGSMDVTGKYLSIENFSGNKHDFLITGVLNTLPANSITTLTEAYPGNFFVSTDNLGFFNRNMNWQNNNITSFIELREGVAATDLNGPMQHLLQQNTSSQVAADMHPHLVPLQQYYLNANNGLVQKMIYALGGIALFLLAMAIINYINMSVSRSGERARETGIRKVLGSPAKQIMLQHLTESIIITAIATVIALALYILMQHSFSTITGKPLLTLHEFPRSFPVLLLLFVLITGFIAGIYPAFILSSLQTISSLKGGVTTVSQKLLMRKGLIAFQFATAIITFTGSVIISQQVNLFLKSDLGYNKEYILSAQVPRNWSQQGTEHMEAIRNQLAAIPQVSNLCLSFEIPDGNNSGSTALYQSGTDSSQAISAQVLITDQHYINVYQIPLQSGSFFTGNAQDSGTIVLNETAAKAMGWKHPAEAAGKQAKLDNDPAIYTIRGVTRDFHFGPMQQKIAPAAFFPVQYNPVYRYLSFKLHGNNLPAAISAIQEKWQALMPGAPFEYRFMDDSLAQLYTTEIQFRKAAMLASLLAVIIVLLGVAGAISFGMQQRNKEMGIRKVLGATVSGIISLFAREFIWTLLPGSLVAFPVAYLLMQYWLRQYAYHITITVFPFAAALLALMAVTALLIVAQTFRTARENPVKSLRNQ